MFTRNVFKNCNAYVLSELLYQLVPGYSHHVYMQPMHYMTDLVQALQ